MDLESGAATSKLSWVNLSRTLLLAYQSFGVVYGDLSTSPLYVYSSTFKGKSKKFHNEDTIFGAFSMIFWTLTMIPLLKYVFILLSADDNGEGGTFALYTLLCRHAKFNLLPNQQESDKEISAYKYGHSSQTDAASPLKVFLEKHKMFRTALLIIVLLGTCMVIGDGVLTPAISVLSSVSGLLVIDKNFTRGELALLACVILVGLFALQHYGTHNVAFLFAPILTIWLISLFIVGLYNTIYWNPKIVRALSPYYILKFFNDTHTQGWMSLGGIILCTTGTEAMFADLGHFTAMSIRLAFAFVIYPCLVMQYMGQAAFLSKNLDSIDSSFYDSIPEPVFWPVFVIATLAAIVGSQAVITATFSIIKQCHALGCFPHVKVVHTSKHISGQIYIPEINWTLMVLTIAITIGFKDTTLIGNAYGLACTMVMFVTTFLMTLVIIFVWRKNVMLAMTFLLFFWAIEGMYLSAVIMKVPQGGWVPLVLSCFFMVVMYVWHYGTKKKHSFDMDNKASLKWLLGLGPCLGVVRVPGIGFVYSELATGVPAIFSHFVTNFPAFHQVLVFVCIKSVPVPYVISEERFLIERDCPKSYRMYRCTVRYGYKDTQRNSGEFENQLIQCIAKFILMEATEQLEFSAKTSQSSSSFVVSEVEDFCVDNSFPSIQSLELQSLDSVESPQLLRRLVRFQLPNSNPSIDPEVSEELSDLMEAKEAGVAYILENSYVMAMTSSSVLKRLVIDYGYSFLRKNCRGAAETFNVPHICLIEVGMIYYV
ncbi:PREDICTED: potassium transporter 4-like [Lupinus angustifolius]|uniref:potassium transporter 4-like n=1 Tax=Lupinus angustifolius TaxID=3871 RepID=UPI00092F46F6|nr:PREDICTED: potassium transporter 4-like [Lupinus angustifolius]